MVFHGKGHVISDKDDKDMTDDFENTSPFFSKLPLMNDEVTWMSLMCGMTMVQRYRLKFLLQFPCNSICR